MSPRRRDAPPGPTLAEQLAERLRERILGGELAPGEPLREQSLAAEYSASRHTVRSALALLVATRLATAAPYRGIRVAALDHDALIALQQLRTALEGEAVRLLRERYAGRAWPAAVTAPIDAALDELAEVCARHPDDWTAVERAHSRVHGALVDAAASPRIAEAHRGLDGEMLLLLLHVRPHYSPAGLVDEHRRLLAEVQERGELAVREHIAHSTELLLASRRAG
ncbi:GntR family transcriptional regulator [Compostimonas suwonensis]|uniref:DNA-binding GntR family transcriptional regulator n=1 Tax=Compostimonas suwonensis TaxID=1048394 RepID=A0A2M9C4Y8_9MICO|nr:GntR family transcriptional regulator [Compostimonas suwonensis]PJJ65559.1 DNA-binding GntR family transcriptional regulator [Compostimonas suwonensis]